MKVLLMGKVTKRTTEKRSSMKSKTAVTRLYSFGSNKRIMGDQKGSIIDSIQRSFEAISPNEAA